MEIVQGEDGQVAKVKAKLPGKNDVVLTPWGEQSPLVFINDYSKCWETGVFLAEKQKAICMSWMTAAQLRNILTELIPHAEGMIEVSFLLFCFCLFVFTVVVFA